MEREEREIKYITKSEGIIVTESRDAGRRRASAADGCRAGDPGSSAPAPSTAGAGEDGREKLLYISVGGGFL